MYLKTEKQLMNNMEVKFYTKLQMMIHKTTPNWV